MPATIYTADNFDYPASILPVNDNVLLSADGVGPMLKWNGTSSSALTAGVTAPTAAIVLADGGAGAITTTNATAYIRYVKQGGIVSDFSPVSNALTITSRQIAYSSIPVPTEAGITKKQIFRTLSGGGATVYLDLEIDTLSVTATSSNNTDAAISLNEAVVLLDADDNIIGNVHGVPPDDRSVLASHLGRIFASGEVNHTRGHVNVTNGSTTVRGIGTYWTNQMAGRLLYVIGGDYYEIASVGEMSGGEQTLTLTTAYTGTTAGFQRYAIRPDPDRRRIFQFSEAFLPESWQAVNAISVSETGDDITALISQNGFLYIVERSHTHRLTYQADPVQDGAVRLLTKRGCVNSRSWCLVGEFIYMLDEQGIYRYDGGIGTEAISGPIQDLFRSDGGYGFKINWRASRWFHCVHYPAQETIRWFVSLSGLRYPRHAICFNHQNTRWWIEEYRYPVASSATARISLLRALIGSQHGEVLAVGVGTLDGVDPELWPRSTVTSATFTTLTDTTASFSSDLVGAPVAITDGRGRGQVRDIVAVPSSTQITLRAPWLVLPDTTSVYQIGGMPWQWVSGVSRWPSVEDQRRELEVLFEPTTADASLDLETFTDFARVPDLSSRSDNVEGVRTRKDESEIHVDLSTGIGKCRQGINDSRAREAAGNEFVQVKASGVSAPDPIRIFEVTVYGTG